jgi:catechol 2,3-dioxygenase-like lactoylglutathione lyase family enzyme
MQLGFCSGDIPEHWPRTRASHWEQAATNRIGSKAVFDHVEINVSDLDASRRFFEAALAPLGYETSFESPEWVGIQAAGREDFGLVRRDPVGPTVHLGFEAPTARLWTHSTTPPVPPATTTTGPPGSGPNMAITTTPRS